MFEKKMAEVVLRKIKMIRYVFYARNAAVIFSDIMHDIRYPGGYLALFAVAEPVCPAGQFVQHFSQPQGERKVIARLVIGKHIRKELPAFVPQTEMGALIKDLRQFPALLGRKVGVQKIVVEVDHVARIARTRRSVQNVGTDENQIARPAGEKSAVDNVGALAFAKIINLVMVVIVLLAGEV